MIKFSRSTNYPGDNLRIFLSIQAVQALRGHDIPWHLVGLGVLAGLVVPSHPKIRSLKLVLTLF